MRQVFDRTIRFFSRLRFVKFVYWLFYDKICWYYYYKFKLSSKSEAKIRVLNLEFTSCCDLKCKWCILDNSRKKGFMDIKFFEQILGEVINEPRIEVEEIALHNAGEALLHPKFKDMLKVLGEKKQEARLNGKKFPYILFLTNAMQLTEDKIKAVLECDAIDFVRFSIDGGTREKFEDIRKGAKWDTVLNNVKNFIKLNKESGKNLRTGIISIIDRDQELAPEFQELIKEVEYMPRPPHNWDGSKDLGLTNGFGIKPKKGFCHFIFKNLAILYDGRVVPCCADLNARGVVGDLNKENLYDIYYGEKRLEMIRKMRNGLRHEIELCRNCGL